MERLYPTGTILAYPADSWGVGLYQIVKPTPCEDPVVFNDKVLSPLTDVIPSRDVWQVVACPFCGGGLLKDGQIHTLQHG